MTRAEKLVTNINKKNNVKAKTLLEKILKIKCAKKIANTLKDIK